jgi:peptidoglycan-N-acetylglucosamine deacetylase
MSHGIARKTATVSTALCVCILLVSGYKTKCVQSAKIGPPAAATIKVADTSKPIPSATDTFWVNSMETAYKTVPEILRQDREELMRGLKFHKFMRGDAHKKRIAITFDDGPHPQYTPKLLEILREHNVKATFFLVGMMAKEYPGLVKAEIAAGHSVGNHTYYHVKLTQIPVGKVAAEIKACDEVIQHITGVSPHLFRPPGGDYNRQVAEVSEAMGYTMVLWTDDPGDYASPGAHTIKVRTLVKVANGGIILLHDGVQQTVNVLPQILDLLEKRGYEMVTIDELMGEKVNRKIERSPE